MAKKKITLKSMTGFGSGTQTSKFGRFVVEIQSVNRRHLEISLSLPQQLNRLENDIRTWLNERVGRGQISLSLFWQRSESAKVMVRPNIELAKSMKKAFEELAKTLKLDTDVTLELLSRESGLLEFQEAAGENVRLNLVEPVLKKAFAEFDAAREIEGQTIAEDFLKRLAFLKKAIEKIKTLSKDATSSYREKLKARLEEVMGKKAEVDERILKEVALFAEKIDIEEEIIRFQSHLTQMQALLGKALNSASDTKGKRIEFLLQELGRESNTIGSKTNLAEISNIVVDIKCELERCREQVQNIE